MPYDDIADALLPWALQNPRVSALWVEGDRPRDVRRPYPVLRLHAAADEPSFSTLLAELPAAIAEHCPGSRVGEPREVPRLARELEVLTGDRPWTLVLERTSLLAKRPRCHVACILDRTGHVTEVMDFNRAP